MSRANRYYSPGLVWHITHRCHKKEFLLKFAKDRRRWIGWLYEAKKRFGLCVLNYIVTSTHIHLLVLDTVEGTVAESMQLIAGRTAQEFNERKKRKGAFWDDRYHATAVDSDEYLLRCRVYVDLNMVRTGVVRHPSQWPDCGYNEIQNPPKRKGIIDINKLMELLNISDMQSLQQLHQQLVEEELLRDSLQRDSAWSGAVAVGSEIFIEKIKKQLKLRASHLNCLPIRDKFLLKEPETIYQVHLSPEKAQLRLDNCHYWDDNALDSIR